MPQIAVIADLHWPKVTEYPGTCRYGNQALAIVREFNEAARARGVRCTVHLGDAVLKDTPVDGPEGCAAIYSELNKSPGTIWHIPGNKEFDCFPEITEWAKITGSSHISQSEDIDGIHIVLFRPGVQVRKKTLPDISREVKWLEKDLAETDMPSIIFSHVPLFTPDVPINELYTMPVPPPESVLFYPQHREIERIITNNNVIGLVSGHLHNQIFQVLDHGHFCLGVQSATEAIPPKLETTHNSYSFIDINPDTRKITIQGYGHGSFTQKLDFQ